MVQSRLIGTNASLLQLEDAHLTAINTLSGLCQ
ncbi:MAG: hypothetical protein QG625_420 [Cyanobacteriota bacterium erpe_2018_sw_39hr_WHONDRS-SW48-000098_B_bin.30]|jgi:hypothetical protein|nr:hypothetical protein [Cyanobacteriota bacterium erpe_2018_sw_39hr_WHONDRS-SW48-000098_B_bin.30]